METGLQKAIEVLIRMGVLGKWKLVCKERLVPFPFSTLEGRAGKFEEMCYATIYKFNIEGGESDERNAPVSGDSSLSLAFIHMYTSHGMHKLFKLILARVVRQNCGAPMSWN